MTSNYVAQLKQRLAETPVVEEPFPHVVLENVFTDEHYQLLQESFLDPSEMETLEGYNDRFVVHLTLVKDWDKDGDPRKTLWLNIAKQLADPEFTRQIVNRFFKQLKMNPKVAKMLKEGAETLDIQPRTLLTRDLNSYFLGPHKDAHEKFATLLIYLPSAPNMGHAGTSFFEPKDPSKEYDTYKHHSFKDFRFLQEVPFAPNTALMFLKTDDSFHGVRPALGKVPTRDLLIHNLYVFDKDERWDV